MTDARKEVNVETIKNCFAKCGFTEQTIEDEDDIVDEEFNASFNKLADSECDMTGEEYVDFNIKTCSSLPTINSVIVDWKLSSVKASVIKYLRNECCDLNEVASDNDDGKDDDDDYDDDDDDDDDDDANSKAVEIAEIGTREALTMSDRLVNLKDLSKEKRNSLAAIKDILEKIRVLNKKQSHNNDYLMLE